jgi:predicted DNA-binding protein
MAYLTIPDELDKRLAALAAEIGVSKDECALYALEEFLDDLEDSLIAVECSQRSEKGIENSFLVETILKELEFAKSTVH